MARGSIFQRNGAYGYRIDLDQDPATGKRRQTSRQGFRTKREVEAALKQALHDIESGTATNRSSADLTGFLDDWLEGQRRQLKETTWSSYRVAVDRIKPALGRRKLRALTPLDIEAFYTHQVKASGLPRIRFHDLRHSYATLALKAGVHPKIVSERLGHATIGITLDLYSHVTPAIARDAADVVASKLFASEEQS
jgi:integrase